MITISMWKYWLEEYQENVFYEDYIFSALFLIFLIIFTPITIVVDLITLPIDIWAYIKSR